MDTPMIQLDEATLARARQLAAAGHCTVEELLRKLVTEKAVAECESAADLVGLLADEPELVDRIMDDVYRTREIQRLRTKPNGSSDS